jgi:hypothetical protein
MHDDPVADERPDERPEIPTVFDRLVGACGVPEVGLSS